MLTLDSSATRKTWSLLGTIAAAEAAVILLQLPVVVRALTVRVAQIPPFAWLLALAIALTYITYCVRRFGLARYLLEFGSLRLLGPLVAVPSAILEEGVFRMTVMGLLAHAHQGLIVQVAGSAIAFGAVHAVWGIRGGARAALGACAATGILGALLAVLYIVSGRALLPCVAAHFIINITIEPWLAYAFALRAQGSSVNVSTAARSTAAFE